MSTGTHERRSNLTVGQNALSTSAEIVLAAKPDRLFAEIKNSDGSISVYIGMADTVTSSNGYLLKAGEKLSFDGYIGPVYAVAASSTPTVTFVEW